MNPDPFRVEDDSPTPFSIRGESMGPSHLNPYAPSSHAVETGDTESDAESFRRRYLAHEASVQAIGMLFLIPGTLFFVIAALSAAGLVLEMINGRVRNFDQEEIGLIIGMMTYGGLGSLQFYCGWGLRKFKRGARWIAALVCGVGLALFPVGTVINGYFLYVLLGKKGKVVFSDEYQDAIRKTPHLQYRSSILVKFFVGLLFAFIGLILVAMLFRV